mmetsp:Transcript_11357/g.14232  ORF Transcript_11357/g.14232 Transcript_11357/m.14232 type:complete len:319 (-) Transcript_11357:976-1932(-)
MLESYRQGALIHFFDIISTHQTHRYWHYGITLPSNNSNSLAAHLKLSDEEYMTFMTGIGLIKIGSRNGKSLPFVIKKEWSTFLIQFELSGIVYFDKMKAKVPTDGIDAPSEFINYREHWLGMGSMDMYQSPIKPSTQFKGCFKKPPRVPLSQKLYELKMIVRKMEDDLTASLYDSGDENNMQYKSAAEEHEFESESNESILSSTLATAENMSQFLDDYKDGKKSKDDTKAIMIEAIKKSIDEDRKKQLEVFIDRVIATAGVDTDDTNNNKEELFGNEEMERKKAAPGMTRLGIPLIPDVLRLIIREIVHYQINLSRRR